MGVPVFLPVRAGKKRPRAAPFGAAIKLLGHEPALQGWEYSSARCLQRPSTDPGSSAQMSLAGAAPCAAEPQA